MTRAELQELMSKPPEALTVRDVEQLWHMAIVHETYRDDPDGLERYFQSHETEQPAYAYLDVTEFGGRVVERVRIT